MGLCGDGGECRTYIETARRGWTGQARPRRSCACGSQDRRLASRADNCDPTCLSSTTDRVCAMRGAQPKHTHLDAYVCIASDRGFGTTACWGMNTHIFCL